MERTHRKAQAAREQRPDFIPTRNNILKRLSPSESSRLNPLLEDVPLTFKEILYEQDEPVDYVYFVETGVVSLITVLEDGDVVETGTVGNEGLVGLTALLGTELSTDRTIVQAEGRAKRMRASALKEEFDRGSPIVRLILRYTEGVLKMVSQTAACNRMHPVEERMSRWLLMTVDRVGDNSVTLTQEFMAQMLGVRRPAVNIAGSTLQKAGLIRYSRGRITVLDRKGLEAASCECYARIRDEFIRVFEVTPDNRRATGRSRGR